MRASEFASYVEFRRAGRGHVAACRMLGRSRSTVDRYLEKGNRRAIVDDAVDEFREGELDAIEVALYDRARRNQRAAEYVLNNSNRSWRSRFSLEHSAPLEPGTAFQVTFGRRYLTEEEEPSPGDS